MSISFASLTRFVFAVLIVFAAMGPTSATVLTFDQNVPVGDSEPVDPGYGDQVTILDDSGLEYGADEGFTPAVSLDYGPAGAGPALWSTSYGDLTNVLYQSLLGSPTLEITLTANPGFLVRLSSFDLAASDGRFGSDPTIESLRVVDGSGTVLFDKNAEIVSKTARNHYQFGTPLEGQTLTIRIDSSNLGADAEGIGIDNITFGQTAERLLPFREPIPISVAIQIDDATASRLALGDLDNDGDQDLLLVGGGQLSWFANEEDVAGNLGAFGPPQPLVTFPGAALSSASTADVDLDGDQDVVVSATGGTTSRVFWIENLGDGNFGDPVSNRRSISSPGQVPGALSARPADIDGDSDLDVLVAASGSAEVVWYENPCGPAPVWTQHPVFQDPGFEEIFRDAVAADIELNGRLDVISASDEGFYWYRNFGDEGFASFRSPLSSSASDARGAVAGDLNGDGLLDAVTAECGGQVRFWPLEDGEGVYFDDAASLSLASFEDCPEVVAVADLNGDGLLDVVAGSSGPNGELSWFQNFGDSFSGGQTVPGTPKGIVDLEVADIDLDGDPDFVFASSETDTVGWLENRRIHRSAVFDRTDQLIDSEVVHVEVGRFDRNAIPDVLTSDFFDALDVYPNAAQDPSVSVAADVPGVNGIVVGDVDADGIEDVVTAGETLELFAKAGPFSATFDNDTIDGGALVAGGFGDVALVDLDRDGRLDVVAVGEDSLGAPPGSVPIRLSWWLDEGNNWEETLIDSGTAGKEPGGPPSRLTTPDLNGDGLSDIVLGYTLFFSNHLAVFTQSPDVTSVGQPTLARALKDDFVGNVYAGDEPFGVAGRLESWRFFDDDGGLTVTPLILETVNIEGMDEFYVVGIGEPRVSDGSGVQEFAFQPIAGSRDLIEPSYRFGWKFGSPDGSTENAGVFDYDQVPEGQLFWEFGTAVSGPAVSQGESLGGPDSFTDPRLYSVEFDVTTVAFDATEGPAVSSGVLRDVTHADLDGDGDDDVAVGTDEGVFWFENDDGSLGSARTLATAEDISSLNAADLDGDGDQDLQVTSDSLSAAERRIFWFENFEGDASSWGRADVISFGPIEDSTIVDLDRDGAFDVVAAASDSDYLTVHRNRGGQYFLSARDLAPSVLYEGQAVPLLAVDVEMNARPGDAIAKLTRLRFGVGQDNDGFNLFNATGLLDTIRVHRDYGTPDVFEPDVDVAIGEIDTFSAGVMTLLPFSSNDAGLRVSDSATFFVVVEAADGGASVSLPSGFSVQHVGDDPGAMVDAETGVALAQEPPNTTRSGAVDVVAPFEVDSTADEPDSNLGDGVCQTASLECTLRAAFMEANATPSQQQIVLEAATYILSVTGAGEEFSATGDLDVQTDEGSVTVIGAGVGQTIIDGAGNDRLFHVDFGGQLTLRGLTLTGGAAAMGGAILNDSGDVVIEDCELTENTASSQGSAIWNDATTEVYRTTIARNRTTGSGQATIWNNDTLELEDSTLWGNESDDTGAIYTGGDGSTDMTRCTVSDNTAIGEAGGLKTNGSLRLFSTTVANNAGGTTGGGIRVDTGGDLALSNSIVADNTATTGPDISNVGGGSVSSSGFNLIGSDGNLIWTPGVGDQANVDPQLEALGDNGAPTFTHALSLNSPGIDGGDCTIAGREPIDLPEIPNAADGCDIGGFETPFGQSVPRIEIPVRWCGMAGAPSIDNPPPGLTANDVMRLRHERASDNTWIPQANVKFRSAANIPAPNYPILADPNTSIGQPGDVAIKPEILEYDEFHQIIAECRVQWQALDPDIVGITAVHIRRFVDAETGVDLDILGLGGRANPNNVLQQMVMGRVMVVDDEFRRNANPPDTLEVLLAHELGHAGSLSHGDGKDNDANQAIDDNDDQFDGLPRLDGPNIMQYRNGTELSVGQILQFRDHVETTIPDIQGSPNSAVAVDSSQIDPAIANVFDFGFAKVFDFGFANVFDFGFANVFDFGFANVFDFGFANVFDFGFANVFDFGFANVFDFGMEFQDDPGGSTTVFNSVGGLGWPSPVRPDTSYFFYLNVDPDAAPATGGVPSTDDFPPQVAGLTGPGEQVDVDLVLELAIGADCSGNICTDTQELFVYEYNPATDEFDQLTVPGAMAEDPEEISVGLYRELGNGEIVEEEQGIAASFQATVPNSLLLSKGWSLGAPLEIQALASVDCTGTVEEGSILDCANSPDLPPGVDPAALVPTSPKNTIEFEPPVLPSCAISSETAGAGSTLTVTALAFPELPEPTNQRQNFKLFFDDSEEPFFMTTTPPAFNADGSVDFEVILPEDAQAGTREITVVQDTKGTAADCFVDLLTCSDFDNDGECDAADFDDDNDGVDDVADPEPLDAFRCGDSDADSCDDCSVAGEIQIANDGLDTASDGQCNAGDDDDDGDTILDGADLAPLDASVCGDSDGDSCDDCSVANVFAPANDGLDTDSDGRCNPGDDDDDSDTIPDAVDLDPLDSSVCGDSDGDTCDDCSQTDAFDPSDDGPDPDSDGLCSAGDGIWFATYTTHAIVGQTVFRQAVYRIAPESQSVDPFASGFLSTAANLIALDVKANGNILFAVESAVTVSNGNKTIRLLPGVIYRWNGTKIKVKFKPSSVGVALSTLNALDQVGGNYYFSVDANKTLRVDGIRYRLFPSQVWRLNPNRTPKLELVRGFSEFGFENVDGVDVLPDGRIAISSQENGTGYGVFDENIYIWDPATDRVELSYRMSALQVDDSAGFTLLDEE